MLALVMTPMGTVAEESSDLQDSGAQPTFADVSAAFPDKVPPDYGDLVAHTLEDGTIRAILALEDRSHATERQVAAHSEHHVFLGTTPHAIAVVSPHDAMKLLDSGAVGFLEPDQPLTHFMSESTIETNSRSLNGGDGIWRYEGGELVSDHPAFDEPVTGQGVTVSIVDSGIDKTHRDFGGWDCEPQPYQPCDSRIKFAGKTQVLPGAFLGGSLPDDLTATLTDLYPEENAPTTEAASGHGTHVAGTIGGNARYTRDSGADPDRYGSDGHNFGMAPEVDLVSISNGDSQWAGLGTAALAWTLDNAEEMDIRVSSNSWGCLGGCSYNAGSSTSQIVKDLYDAGVVVTFAVGNDGGGPGGGSFSGYSQSPYVLGVANYDHHNGNLAAGSSRGAASNDDLPDPATWDPEDEASTAPQGGHRRPDVAAPGTSIWSARTLTGGTSSLVPRITTEDAIGGGTNGFVPYVTMSGTSMAAPHVSGAAALLFDACPGGSALDIMRAIMVGADPDRINGDRAGYEQGYGALDVRASLDWLITLPQCGVVVQTPEIRITSPTDGAAVDASIVTVSGDVDRSNVVDSDGGSEVAGSGATAPATEPETLALDVGDARPENVYSVAEALERMASDSPDGPIAPGHQNADGIGPGSGLLLGGQLCTAAWLFQDPSDGVYYLSTAGHCLQTGPDDGPKDGSSPDVTDVVEICFADCRVNWAAGLDSFLDIRGDYVRLETGGGYDPVAFAQAEGLGNDFGLIRIPSSANDMLRPWLPQWGGATDIYTGSLGLDHTAVHYGHGSYCCPASGAFLTRTEADQGRIAQFNFNSDEHFEAVAGWASGGDSGSAVGRADPAARAAGKGVIGAEAVGVLTHGVLPAHSGFFGTMLDHGVGMATAHDAVFSDLRLVLEDEETQSSGNLPPSTDAGGDQSATEGDEVTLDGTCTDSDGTIDSCAWSQVSGPTVQIVDEGDGTARFTAPAVDGDQQVVVRLTATDDAGATGSDDATVTVRDSDGGDTERVEILVDGDLAASVPVGPTDADAPVASWSLDVDFTPYGDRTVTVQADWLEADGTLIAVHSISVDVGAGNEAPAITVPGPQQGREGFETTFDVTADDPDGDDVAVTAEDLPAGASFDGTTFSWTPASGDAGTYTVTFTAEDGRGGSDSDTVDLTIDARRVAIDTVGGEDAVPGMELEPGDVHVEGTFEESGVAAAAAETLFLRRDQCANLGTDRMYLSPEDGPDAGDGCALTAGIAATALWFIGDPFVERYAYEDGPVHLDSGRVRGEIFIGTQGAEYNEVVLRLTSDQGVVGEQVASMVHANALGLLGVASFDVDIPVAPALVGSELTGLAFEVEIVAQGAVHWTSLDDPASYISVPFQEQAERSVEVRVHGGAWQAAASEAGAWSATISTDGIEGDTAIEARLLEDGGELDRETLPVHVVVPDADGDGVPDSTDNCPDDANPDQADLDGDGIGDACDDQDNRDSDGDGVENWEDRCEGFDDSYDHDGDGVPDGCDEDADDKDGDGIDAHADNCPGHANPGQEDMDGDGTGDACDPDRDGDGHTNKKEEAQGSDPDDPESQPS